MTNSRRGNKLWLVRDVDDTEVERADLKSAIPCGHDPSEKARSPKLRLLRPQQQLVHPVDAPASE